MPEAENKSMRLEFWWLLWKRRVLFLAITLGAGVLAAVYSLTLPNIYKANVLLAPVSQGAQNSSSLGGLATLAGLPTSNGGDNDENLAVLQSRKFIWSFITDQKLMPILFEKAWDSEKGKWKDSNPIHQPTMWDGLRKFSGLLHVSKDKMTGLVTVSIEYTDAKLAAKWANALVAKVNEYLRQRAIAESAANLEYLNRELLHIHVEGVRQALFQLISQEQKKAMLANSRKQYAYRVIDPALAPDLKVKPKRSRFVIFWTFIAGFMVTGFIYLQEYVRCKKNLLGITPSGDDDV